MEPAFEITQVTRKQLSEYLDDYSLEQLNKVPHGFSNNLIWNIAHVIVVQQMLVYNLSGLPMLAPPEMVAKYKRGTKPEHEVGQPELAGIKSLLFKTIDQTKADFENQVFTNYTEYTTVTGFTMRSAKDAMGFNCYHEAMHLGMMAGIRKFV